MFRITANHRRTELLCLVGCVLLACRFAYSQSTVELVPRRVIPDPNCGPESTTARPIPTNLNWYAGTWDSTIYDVGRRPRTIGLRVQVVDSQTNIPLPDVTVALRGYYLEEVLGPITPVLTTPYPPEPSEPRCRDFLLAARTGSDGVAVFALNWVKEFPWYLGRPPTKQSWSDKHQSGQGWSVDLQAAWIRPVDEVEKVRFIEIRAPHYEPIDVAFNLSHLLEFGQNRYSERQEPQLFDAFEAAWRREIAERKAILCVVDLGTGFSDFKNAASTRPEFFSRIRAEEFGKVYAEPVSWYDPGERPQSLCGPYMVYRLKVNLARLAHAGPRPGGAGQPAGGPRPFQPPHQSGGRDGLAQRPRGGPSSSPPSSPPLGQDRAAQQRREQEQQRQREQEQERERQREREKEQERQREREREEERRREEQRRREAEQAARSNIGVSVATLTSEERSQMGLPIGVRGVKILSVAGGSAGSKAGISSGMVVESIQHRAISGPGDWKQHVDAAKPGDSLSIGLWQKSGDGKWARTTRTLTIPGN